MNRDNTQKQTIYQANGFASRQDYLKSLCEDYPEEMVMMCAELLGPNEDFDALVTTLEDNFS